MNRNSPILRTILLIAACTAWAAAADLRAGLASIDITPPEGTPMAGYYRVRLSTGTHDPLQAKALMIESGGVKVALVAVDLVGIPEGIVKDARTRIQLYTGIPPSHVMISATHSHTGPETGSRLTGVEPDTKQLAQGYLTRLPALIADCVVKAAGTAQPARLYSASGQQDSISFIRRFRMKDGTVGWNPGKQNPNIVHPMGTIDPEAASVLIESADGKPLGAYVNFANHLDTVGGTEFSADYPFALSESLKKAMGPAFLTIFTIGTAGQINHTDVSTKRPQKGHEEAARIGTILAGAILDSWRNRRDVSGPLQAKTVTLDLPAGKMEPDAPEKARRLIADYGQNPSAPFLDLVRAFRALDLERLKGVMKAEVQVITLGDDLAWVGLPGEIFVELGKILKIRSPFRHTIIAELANGSPGYIPDKKAYDEGAYEVISSRFAPGAGEAMVDTAVDMLIEMHRAARK